MSRPPLTARLSGFGTSVFAEYTALAMKHGAINLGQGFPDFDGPDFVKQAAIAAIRDGKNQYSPMIGLLDLRQAVAEHQRRFYGLDYDPEHEVTVYAGATEGIFSALQALLDPGDEVILFEPYYDSYPAGLAMAGASPRIVTLAGRRLPPRPRSPRGRHHAADPGGDAQQPAEPGGQGLLSRGARGDRGGVPPPRPPCRHRRGLRAPGLRRLPPAPRRAARDARAAR